MKKPEVFVAAHQTPAIDYVTVHMWLKNWGWLKDPQLSGEFEQAVAKAKDHVETHTVLATDTLHKPLVLEEFGLPRDHEKYEPGTPTTARDDYYGRMFQQVADSCQAGRALQGANFWTWAGRVARGQPGRDCRQLHGRSVLRAAGPELGARYGPQHFGSHPEIQFTFESSGGLKKNVLMSRYERLFP